jgi:tetratricopeptide (TPR) repeat protein
MDDLVAEFQRLMADLPGTGLIGALTLLERQLDPVVAQQLRLCAIPHQFDQRLLMVMTPELDDGQAQALCADIGQLSVVLARGDGYALHDEARDHLLTWWLRDEQARTFAQVSARLADHFDRRASDTSAGAHEQAEQRRMYHRLGADQEAGFGDFERLFRAMRHQFRLDACEALVHLVHEYDAVLTADHQARLAYHEGKLAADRRAWGEAALLFGRALAADGVDPITQIKARNRLGCVVAETHQWTEAIELQRAALDEVRALDQPGTLEYRVMHDLGAAYRDSGDLDQAREVLTQSATLAESAGNVPAQATAYNSLGTLWRRLGDTPEAIRAYERSLDALLRTDDPYRPAQVYNNLGVACSELRDWDKSEAWFTRSLEIKQRAGDTVGQAMTLGNLARVCQQRGEVDRAIEMLEKAITLFAEMHDRPSIAAARRQTGRLHAIAGRLDRARAALSEAADIWDSCSNADEAAATRKERDDLGRRRVPGWIMMLGTAVMIGAGLYWWWTTLPAVKGARLLEQGRPAEAIEPLTEALNADPADAASFSNRGFAYYLLGRYEDVIPDMSKAIELDPDEAINYMFRGESLAAANRFEAALDDFQKAVALAPDNGAIYRSRSYALILMKRFEEAVADASTAISLDAGDAIAFRNRGFAHLQLGRHDAAITDLTQSLALFPNDIVAYQFRASAHQAVRRHEEAAADLTTVIEQTPNDPAPYNYRFFSNFELRRDAQAVDDADRAITLDPTSSAPWNNRGLVRFHLGRYQDALDDLSKAISLQSDVPNSYNHRGRVEAHLNQLDSAIADFSKAIEVDPRYAMAYGNRGFIYHLRSDRDRARSDYLKQVELERTGAPTSRPLVLLALDAFQSNRSTEAATYCGQALDILSDGEPNAHYRDEALSAALCKLLIGKTEEALIDYRSAAATASEVARGEAVLRLRLLPRATRGATEALAELTRQP